MLNIVTKCLFISLLIVISTVQGIAQPKDNSPFSQFGFGDFIDSDMPSTHAMGGLGAIYHDFFEANLDNPASLGFLQYTSLQLGFMVKRSTYTRVDDKQTVWNGNTNHFSLNIPIINPLNQALERREATFSWATSISLRPFSQVGYNVQITDDIDSIGTINRSFRGSGGLYTLTWGNGFKYKNLAVGINLGYLKGKQFFDGQTTFLDLENVYNNLSQANISYKGFQYRLGAMYELPLDLKTSRDKDDKPSKLLSAGMFVSGNTNMTLSTDNTVISVNDLTSDVDTSIYETDLPGKGNLPGAWGVGLLYHKASSYRIGIDYQGAAYSKYTNDARPDTLMDSYRIAAGGAWIPDAGSITSYFKRVEYRAGFYYKSDPRVIDKVYQVKEGAFTFGASLPFIVQRNISWFQFSLDVGSRTGGPNLKDNFVRANIGFIFNDNSWFIKGKYD